MYKVFTIGFCGSLLPIFSAQNSFACSVCYGAANASAALALKISVISLLGILFCVASGFVWFFVQTARRAKEMCLIK